VARVNLRPIRSDDAEICFRWVSDPDVVRFLGLLQPARTIVQERSWIASVLADKQHKRIFVIEDERGAPIGTCGLRGIDPDAGTAFFGIMIGQKDRWDQGYGTAAARARLSCHGDNQRAVRCYEKAGFRPSRHRPERFQFGRDEVRMAIDRDEWLARVSRRPEEKRADRLAPQRPRQRSRDS
jgi:RimJ/RimL family protein N-acetyltransferase